MRTGWVVAVSLAVAGLLGLAAGRAIAQGTTLPGQIVGSGFNFDLGRVGNPVPRAAPPAGTPINLPTDNPLIRRYDPKNPYAALEGTGLSKSQVIAPMAAEQSLLDKLKALVGLRPAPAFEPTPGWFPSLSRRNRERAEQRLWRRD